MIRLPYTQAYTNNIYIYICVCVCVCVCARAHTHLCVRINKSLNAFVGSIPGHVIPKTLKMVLDTSLLNIQ